MFEFLLAAAVLVGFTLLSLLRPRPRLLEDNAVDDSHAISTPPARTTSLLIGLLVPLLAGSLYVWLGQPAALDELARQGRSPGEAGDVVAALAARLAARPDDPRGWADLARSYRAMGSLHNARAAFERIGPELDRDPALLAEYAELLATTANGSFEGKPLALVERALRLAPDTPLALALAATAASNRNDLPQAMSYWGRLLKQLPPGSDDAKWVADQLAKLRDSAGRPR